MKTRASYLTISKATRRDAKAIVGLIVGLANFERLKPPDAKGKVRLVRDIFEKKLANVLIAKLGKFPVGYALYFYTYSSFRARPTLYLEDIFVTDSARGKGVGEALFNGCFTEARSHGCGRMEWQVLNWNRSAMRFYKRHGAIPISNLVLFRLDTESGRR